MQSNATTVDAYLASLPEDRRSAIEAVRRVILANLDGGYEEGMQYGMIGYYVPHAIYPAGYHCDPNQPLPFVCLASQKNYMSLYLGCVYGDSSLAQWFHKEWEKTGKKLDMGKSCVRFKKAEDLALDVIGETIRRIPVARYIETYEAARDSSSSHAKKAAGKSLSARAGKAAKRAGKSVARAKKAATKNAVKRKAR